MALHLNLYHEVHRQQALQRRDPLKLAIAGIAFIAACFAGYYLLQLNAQRITSNELAELEKQLATLGPKAEADQKRAAEFSETLKASKVLVGRMENRFYWAPILSDLIQVVPPQVQLTRFAGDVSNDEVRQFSFTLDGVAAGEDARKVAEDFRRALGEHFSTKFSSVNSSYRTLEDSPEPMTLNGKKLPFVNFGINVVMKVTTETEATTK